jgi:hypothetical protein
VAQCCHEGLLRRAGCYTADTVLKFGERVPSGDLFEGAYIDDHLLVARVPIHRLHDRDVAQDTARLEASRKAYEEADLPRAEKKSFDREARLWRGGWASTVSEVFAVSRPRSG